MSKLVVNDLDFCQTELSKLKGSGSGIVIVTGVKIGVVSSFNEGGYGSAMGYGIAVGSGAQAGLELNVIGLKL
jgi:hypothetical protein